MLDAVKRTFQEGWMIVKDSERGSRESVLSAYLDDDDDDDRYVLENVYSLWFQPFLRRIRF